MEYYVLTFENTSQAIKFEQLYKKEEPGAGVLLPVPRRISSSCGLAAKIDISSKSKALSLVTHHNIGVEALYRFMQNGREVVVEEENLPGGASS